MTTREPPGSGFPEALADTNQHTLDLLGRLPGAPPAALTPLVPPVQEDFSWSVAESAALRGREATAVLPGPGASRPPLGNVEGVGCKASPGRFVVGPVRSRAGFCSPPGPRGHIEGEPPLCSHTELQTGGELVCAPVLPAAAASAGGGQAEGRGPALESPAVLAAVICTLTCASSRSPGLCQAGSGGHWLVAGPACGVWGELAPYLTSEEWVWDLTAACVAVLGAGAAG